MKRLAVAYVAGLLFAAGLAVSGMTHPAKVQAFLDFAGDWDPSLALVMGVGVAVNLVGFSVARRRGGPLLAPSFALPQQTAIDASLVVGSAIFGVGWGLGGFCPGPAVVSAAAGALPAVAFVVAMLATMALFDVSFGRAARPVSASEV